LTAEQILGVYVKSDDGRNFVGMSNICTHLACLVRWVEDERKFYCPCHAGIYDEDGNVISGPPPRPLDRYEITVEEGKLLLHFDGTSEQSGSQTS
jgi:cytochrome b6-f complex iron-sulfur subunit